MKHYKSFKQSIPNLNILIEEMEKIHKGSNEDLPRLIYETIISSGIRNAGVLAGGAIAGLVANDEINGAEATEAPASEPSNDTSTTSSDINGSSDDTINSMSKEEFLKNKLTPEQYQRYLNDENYKANIDYMWKITHSPGPHNTINFSDGISQDELNQLNTIYKEGGPYAQEQGPGFLKENPAVQDYLKANNLQFQNDKIIKGE
jgi:hypothetical protein